MNERTTQKRKSGSLRLAPSVGSRLALAIASLAAFTGAVPASAQNAGEAVSTPAPPATDSAGEASTSSILPAQTTTSSSSSGSDTDIFSKNTVSALLDARLVASNGERSFVNGGFGKTRFQGTADGGYRARFVPAEADLIWEPRFTKSLSANVSAAYQHDHDDSFDLIEA